MISPRLGGAPPQAVPNHEEFVALDRGRPTEGPDRLGQPVEPVALLLTEVGRRIEPRLARRMSGHERQDRNFVNHEGKFARVDDGSGQPVAGLDLEATHGLPQLDLELLEM